MAKKKTSSFRNKVAKDTQRQKTAGSNYGYLRLPNGVGVLKTDESTKMMLDFMPYLVSDKKHPDLDPETETAVVGSLWYKRPYKVHRNIGSTNDSVVCLSSIGKPCPICEFRTKRIKEGAEKEELDALKASQRNLYVVIPKGVKGHEEVPHIWDISQYLFQNLLNDELEENDENAVFPDLEEGLTLKIRFEEKQLGKNKFKEVSRIDFVQRSEPYDEAILEDIPDLDKVLTILSYKELEAKFMEIDPEDSSDDDIEEEDDTPKKRPSKKATKPVEEEDDEDDEDDDTPPPPKKRPVKSSRPIAVQDNEVEPDEDEEEDEEEQPSTQELVINAESIEELLQIAKEYPTTFRFHMKNLRTITKLSKLKSAMSTILKEAEDEEDGDDDIPFKKEEKTPLKKHQKNNDDEDEYEEDEPKPTRKSKVPEKKSKNKCPHGYKFGIDTDEYSECDNCKIWDACIEMKEDGA